MKRLIFYLHCILLTSTLMGQTKYSVPEVSTDDKLSNIHFQFWAIFATSVDFAKSQGFTPYDYGKYIGEVFAPTWNKEAGFEGLVNGILYNWETTKTDEDGNLTVKENADGSVVISLPKNAWKKHFSDDYRHPTFEEVSECMKGVLDEIATHMGAKVVQKITGEEIVWEIRKTT